ncbi:uncharacterized protein LOC142768946 isoform X2 [Rhipicephalus microplus]|uniref:uncharacterized protein LOC142768946 isoform X2 n=1 Tax=Rhipicephalus microplus TaxID=6941 RepID=UPI003F6A7680
MYSNMNPAVLLFFIAYIASTHAFYHNDQYSPWLNGKHEQDNQLNGKHEQDNQYQYYSEFEWSLPKVGQGVSVTARVFYDSTLKSSASLENEVTEDEKEPTLEDFKKLFKEVEAFFNSLSIMIKIEVVSVQQIDSLGVEYTPEPGSLEANFTLENLKTHVATQQDANNTVNYLFTRKPLFAEETADEEVYFFYGTHKAFCSTRTSAIVVHYESMNDSTNAVRATAWLRCPKSTCAA